MRTRVRGLGFKKSVFAGVGGTVWRSIDRGNSVAHDCSIDPSRHQGLGWDKKGKRAWGMGWRDHLRAMWMDVSTGNGMHFGTHIHSTHPSPPAHTAAPARPHGVLVFVPVVVAAVPEQVRSMVIRTGDGTETNQSTHALILEPHPPTPAAYHRAGQSAEHEEEAARILPSPPGAEGRKRRVSRKKVG